MNHLHVCLVSAHAEANLIPLLAHQPQQAVLVTTDQMQARAEALQTLLADHLPTCQVTLACGLADADPGAIEEFALELAARLEEQFPDHQVTYNMTGGTKVMALLFHQVFSTFEAGVIYTDTAHNQIQHLAPRERLGSSEEIAPLLDAKLYLQANGKTMRRASSDDADWQAQVAQRKALTKWLAHHADALEGLFGVLNRWIHQCVTRNGGRQQGVAFLADQARQTLNRPPKKAWREALERLNAAGVLGWSAEMPTDVCFADLESCVYLGGGWLEEYAWHCAQQAGLDETHCNLEITDRFDRKADIRNEIDCLAVHRNRMLIVECKTLRLGQDEAKDQDLLSKLDSLTERASGLFGSKLLLSARPLGDEKSRVTNLQRARSLGIEVLEGSALKRLPALLDTWKLRGQLSLDD